MDLSTLTKCGKLPYIIGISAFVFPLSIGFAASVLLRNTFAFTKDIYDTLPVVVSLESTTSFHAILVWLTDLNLLNSELGRLALSSSLICGIISWAFLMALGIRHDMSRIQAGTELQTQLSKLVLLILTLALFRPILFYMRRNTPEGEPLKESYIVVITLLVFGSAFFGEVTGNHYFLGPIFMGMATPDRPPIGSTLQERVGCFLWLVLMPCNIISIGRKVDVFIITQHTLIAGEILSFVITFVKLIAVLIPSLYHKMPFLDALSLAFLMNCKGLFDIQAFDRARRANVITDESFGIMVLQSIVHTAILIPLVKACYSPSRRYVAYNRRTIQHSEQHSELRMLACVHDHEDVSAITCILEASNPSRSHPLCIYVMHLKELVGRTLPFVIKHDYKNLSSFKQNKISHVANAFHQYADQNEGQVKVQCLTANAPYASMDDDVCSFALEKDCSAIIIPSSEKPQARVVNQNVLEKAPCSVGILVIRGMLKDCRSIISTGVIIKVCVVFLGGPDDREALSYGERMAHHPNVRLTVLRLAAEDQPIGDMIEKRMDMNLINFFMVKNMDNHHTVFKEELLGEAMETVRVLKNVAKSSDLVLVGRKHDIDSPLIGALSMWSEMDELGVIGDLLASPEFETSVLVMQQQASVVEKMVKSAGSFSNLFNSKSKGFGKERLHS
ncbi:hypothetical protein ACFE04_001401 [Oxalis oulophora]